MSTFNFRAEVAAHRSASPLGHIAIEPRPAQTLVTLGIVALCAALLVFCGTYEVSRRVTVPGVILPHVDSTLHAAAFATRQQAADIRAGQTALVSIAAHSSNAFGKVKVTVVSVADAPASINSAVRMATVPLLRNGAATDDPPCVITLRLHQYTVTAPGAVYRLQSGLTLRAHFIRDRRSLLAWLTHWRRR